MENLNSINLFDFIISYDAKAKGIKRFGWALTLITDDEKEAIIKNKLKDQLGSMCFDFINDFMQLVIKKGSWNIKDVINPLKEVIGNPYAYLPDINKKWEDLRYFFQWYDNTYLLDKQHEQYIRLVYGDINSVDMIRNNAIYKATCFLIEQLKNVKLEAGLHYTLTNTNAEIE